MPIATTRRGAAGRCDKGRDHIGSVGSVTRAANVRVADRVERSRLRGGPADG